MDTFEVRFWQLLDNCCNERLQVDELAALEAALHGNADRQRLYRNFCRLHTDLHLAVSARQVMAEVEEQITSESRAVSNEHRNHVGAIAPALRASTPGRVPLSTITIAIAFYGTFVFMAWTMSWGRTERARISVPTTEVANEHVEGGPAVAHWTRLPISDHQHKQTALRATDLVNFEEGQFEVTFHDGARVVVTAPVRFEVLSAGSSRLTRGSLVATVPRAAAGFTIETPAATIVDLGTEFGVEITPDGDTDVHVLKGRVKALSPAVDPARKKSIDLQAGQARRLSRDSVAGKMNELEIQFDAAKFASSTRRTLTLPKPIERWRAHSKALQRDPALVAYYDFETPGETLLNVVSDKLHATIHCSGKPPWTSGRWHGKGGLVFGDQFATASVPADPALTPRGDWSVAVWFRLDAAPDFWTSIVGQGVYPQRALWTLMHQPGQLCAMITHDQDEQLLRMSRPLPINAWSFVVTVLDANALRLYLDGVAVASGPFGAYPEIESRPLMIGRSEKPDSQHTFNGVIDELAILRRALSPEDIKLWYEAGRP